jgi:CRP-like cAMP-binding protein
MERPGGPLSANLVEKLARDDFERLFALGRSRVVEAGTALVRQGSRGDCLFIVEQGELDVVRALPGDEEERIITAHAGMVLGEMAVLDGGVRAATLRALTRCVVRVIGVGAFDALTLHGGEAGLRVLRAVAGTMHERLDATCGDAEAEGVSAPVGEVPGSRWTAATPAASALLGILQAFAPLEADERESLRPRLAIAELGRGEDVVLPQPSAPGVTFVLRGAVSPLGADGMPHETRPPIGPGGFVDYASALGFGERPRTWRARSPTRLARLDPVVFEAASPCAARLLHALARDIAITLRRATGRRMHFEMAWAHEVRRTGAPPQLRVAQEA